MTQPPQDPPVRTGPWQPRTAERAALHLLHAGDGYPDLCRTGIWYTVVIYCLACGAVTGECGCDEYAAQAATTLAHPLPDPVRLATAGGAR